ncbi:hypothetical protein CK203_076032 [Vitis vinifera]|uniref:Uncharacterized protein n=1 Tax=Vitis vinifera TaxID=29760 RepID=A0A438C2P3_VITVI|nr:hypothetical protein CK203_076032 [Vitis vinifera]
MDQRVVTVDQFTIAMASIQGASASPKQEIDMPRAPPYMLHGHFEVASPALRLFGSSSTWDDFDSIPVASPPAKFKMPDIERRVTDDHYVSFISEWCSLALVHIFGVSRRELEGLRQRSDEFISSFISHWQGKIAEIVDRPLQRDDSVLMVIRGLIRDPRGKFRPNWSGPYFIRELTLKGVAWLMDLDGNRFSEPTNVDQLKRTDSIVFGLPGLFARSLSLTGCSLRRGHDRYLTGPPRSIQLDDFMTFVLPTCRALDTIPGRIFYFQMRFTDLHGDVACSMIDDFMMPDLRPIICSTSYWGILPFWMRFTDLGGVWSLSGVTQLGPHFSIVRCRHASLPGDAPSISESDSVVDTDDLDRTFDEG